MSFPVCCHDIAASRPQTSTSVSRIPAATVAVTTRRAATGVCVASVTESAGTPAQVNTPGGHRSCMIGCDYRSDLTLRCVCVSDVDECEDPLQCPGQECINSQGSYRCVSCQPGYRLSNRLCTGEHTCPYRLLNSAFNAVTDEARRCDCLQTSTSAARRPAPTLAVKTHLEATAVSVAMVTSSRTTPAQVTRLLWILYFSNDV